MSLTFNQNTAMLTDQVSVEDAETLLEWLVQHPSADVDLSELTHLHAANLQVLMAIKPNISAWPQASDIHAWLRAALNV